MVQELQVAPIIYIMPIIEIIALLALTAYGIILFIKSKQTPSKSLKVGILLPLIASVIGLIWWVGSLIDIIDFDAYLLLGGLFGGWLIVSIVSIIFSIIALVKIERKSLATASLVYGLIYFIIWLIFILTFKGM